jgi:hypothetical protein
VEIRIFQILISDRVSRASLEMAGGRKSDGDAPYYLKFGEQFTLGMSIEKAQSFAWSVRRMVSRLRWTHQTEEEIQAG